MAHVAKYKATDGSTRYRVRYRTPGRKQSDKRGFRTKREAQRFAAQVETDKATGTYIAPSAGRVATDTWVETWLANRSDLKPTTAERYAGIVRTHIEPRWRGIPVSAVLPSAVQEWVADMTASGLAPASVRKAHRVLSLALDAAVQDRMIASNPAVGVKIAKPNVSPRRYLDHQQIQALAENACETGRPVVYVLAYCGLRWGEMAALHVRDIDLARRRITVATSVTEVHGRLVWGGTKTYQRRTVPIPQFLVPIIEAAVHGKASNDIAFTTPAGAVMRCRNARRDWFDQAVIDSGSPDGFHPHELRHCAASLAISAGANVKAIQTMLGHASAAMTLDTYADLFADDLDEVAAHIDRAATAARR